MREFSWTTTLASLGLGALLIGGWLTILVSVALNEISRGTMVVFHFSEILFALATLGMLAGVGLLAIQVAVIVDHVTGHEGH